MPPRRKISFEIRAGRWCRASDETETPLEKSIVSCAPGSFAIPSLKELTLECDIDPKAPEIKLEKTTRLATAVGVETTAPTSIEPAAPVGMIGETSAGTETEPAPAPSVASRFSR